MEVDRRKKLAIGKAWNSYGAKIRDINARARHMSQKEKKTMPEKTKLLHAQFVG
jgi:hypothetical protein